MSKIKNYKSTKRRLYKKAQVEAQFNWIFILIAGGLILAFFSYVVIKQKAASEIKLAGKITKQLNTVLTGAKVSSGATELIPISKADIRFSCNDYYIGAASQRLGNRVVFAPEFINSDKIITWALDWNLPFKVNTFLYLTSPLTRYIVIGDSSTILTKINNSLPDTLNKDYFVDASDPNIVDEDDEYVRFIYVTPSPPSHFPSNLNKEFVSGIWISQSSVDKKMIFLKKTESGFSASTEYAYANDPIMFGAIFSDRTETFRCVVERAYKNLNIVAQVYQKKFNELAPFYEGSACEGFYKNNQDISTLISLTNKTDYNIIQSNLGSIMQTSNLLRETNDKAEINSCPLIY